MGDFSVVKALTKREQNTYFLIPLSNSATLMLTYGLITPSNSISVHSLNGGEGW